MYGLFQPQGTLLARDAVAVEVDQEQAEIRIFTATLPDITPRFRGAQDYNFIPIQKQLNTRWHRWSGMGKRREGESLWAKRRREGVGEGK